MSDQVVAAEAPAFCTQADFARLQGWDRSYVTKLKGEGRLVFDEAGKVNVQASIVRIRETSGALERSAAPVQGTTYSKSQEDERFYSAQLKRLEYEREIKKVLETADVLAVIADAGTLLRSRLESWPDRLAPQISALAGDEARIRALLADHIEGALTEFSQRCAALSAA